MVKQQIIATIPTSVTIQVQSRKSVAEVWKAICAIYEDKSDLMHVDLHSQLQNMKCADKDDVCTHVTNMMMLCEELAGMGAPVNDQDFIAMILGSLPTSLCGLLRSTTAAVQATGKTLTPEMIIAVIFKEADHIKIDNGGSSTTNDTALAALSKGQKHCGKGKSKKSNMTCKNCKHIGHSKNDCWCKGGGKEGQGPHQKKKSANAATEADDYAFLTSTLSDSATVCHDRDIPPRPSHTCSCLLAVQTPPEHFLTKPEPIPGLPNPSIAFPKGCCTDVCLVSIPEAVNIIPEHI